MAQDPRNAAERLPQDAIVVQFLEDTQVLRVDVVPGDTVVLPFDADAPLQMKTGSGNLAIRDDRDHDHTVILRDYEKTVSDPLHPVTIESRDGTAIDVAVVLAMTDPNLDVHGCGGPAPEPAIFGGGGIYRAFEGGTILHGFEAIGRQDDSAPLTLAP
jgi:hypothetical protein